MSSTPLTLVSYITVVILMLNSAAEGATVPVLVFEETFTGVASDPATGTFTDFTQAGSGTSTGNGTQLVLDNSGNPSPNRDLGFFTIDTFGSDTFTVKGQARQDDGPAGGSVTGMVIGNRGFTFFGGFGGGAFRMTAFNPLTGQYGGDLIGNTNMGYTPAQDVFQDFEIFVNTVTGDFDITITDSGAAGSFNIQYLGDAGFVPGGVGFWNWSQSHQSTFDNLQVIVDVPVPEPSTFLLLGLGALGLVRQARRRRRRA